MKNILEWLKLYNSDKSDLDKISIYGFDMQFTKPTLSRLKMELEELNYTSISLLDTIHTWKTSTQVNLNYLNKVTTELVEFANTKNGHLKSKLLGLIHSMTTSINYLKIIDPYQRANFRDKFMADNIIKVSKSKPAKTIIWAHNEHITKKGNIKIWHTMGEHLKETFGNDYYMIGLITSKGQLGFYNRNIKRGDSLNIPLDSKDSYESTFIKCEAKCFFINLLKLKGEAKTLFSKNKAMITIDLIYDPKKNEYIVKKSIFKNNLIDKFDGIIFIESTTAARH